MKLDATPLGKPLYAKLGFVDEYEIELWILKRPPAVSRTARSTCPRLVPVQLEQIFQFDSELFGADRSFLLRSLHDQNPEFAVAVYENGLPQGYAFGRRGLFADHLGPWKLLQVFLAQSLRETLIVDCLKSNPVSVELLRACGFVPSRPLTRMVRGPNDYPGRPDSLCAILGPEFG